MSTSRSSPLGSTRHSGIFASSHILEPTLRLRDFLVSSSILVGFSLLPTCLADEVEDFGILTFLMSDPQQDSLQVRAKSGAWISADPIPVSDYPLGFSVTDRIRPVNFPSIVLIADSSDHTFNCLSARKLADRRRFSPILVVVDPPYFALENFFSTNQG